MTTLSTSLSSHKDFADFEYYMSELRSDEFYDFIDDCKKGAFKMASNVAESFDIHKFIDENIDFESDSNVGFDEYIQGFEDEKEEEFLTDYELYQHDLKQFKNSDWL